MADYQDRRLMGPMVVAKMLYVNLVRIKVCLYCGWTYKTWAADNMVS